MKNTPETARTPARLLSDQRRLEFDPAIRRRLKRIAFAFRKSKGIPLALRQPFGGVPKETETHLPRGSACFFFIATESYSQGEESRSKLLRVLPLTREGGEHTEFNMWR